MKIYHMSISSKIIQRNSQYSVRKRTKVGVFDLLPIKRKPGS